MTDRDYMKRALSLAGKGTGAVNPNPLVGAVIVKEGRIIGEGWHKEYGGPHAERDALASCSASAQGADLYVTLEPCCHYGKTPPCTEAILESGIRRVVVGAADPNPLVAGKGIRFLREKGILVEEGVLEDECKELNRVFFHYMKSGMPYVVLKYAMTMDGKIAAVSGKSKWITGELAREHVQKDRNRYVSIMTGAGTVLADDPLLTCRYPGGRNPVRIICDTSLKTPLESKIIKTAETVPTIIATGCQDETLLKPYRKAGCQIYAVPVREGHIDLKKLMGMLGKAGIDSVLLEGGSTLNWSALKSGIVNRVQAYIAPKIFGGKGAATPVGGIGAEFPEQAFLLGKPAVTWFGEDILLESEVLPCLQES
ncbi:bifunctional diaminohydroxyphosphoribosylaminopyrimidine deaminase/5-amino-6-(5-phosphoribosylamino)uracil reductase RibD [Clostridium sp. Marseille-P2415]|uniref:bifunctional diaminohydroxyphosphoribosylaminopyrimidine deaminase/5-amino-6-(5-phosphoribosylamino)uracil reductase RibD n=1 Tax=Clostridium sp. Marseille-P2415 TaxID=1805471 RepID=UPI00098834A2|nr:bifunctional diaminohydroxyphosphoribosylaminopyrimidine deaminase/5-amino-6-(5-phosphoribosylamino)uracil reductase RibD [Clostridium sp. Marseille-P2415]